MNCKKRSDCFDVECGFQHEFDFCPSGKSCNVFTCHYRHVKNRTRKCSLLNCNGMNGCKFLHAKTAEKVEIVEPPSPVLPPTPILNKHIKMKAETSCKEKDLCMNVFCGYRHSPHRIPVCVRGSDCKVDLCWFLHQPGELEICLAQNCDSYKVRNIQKSIQKARALHSQKIQKLLVEIRRVEMHLQDPALDATQVQQLTDVKEMKYKACREIVGQRDSVDVALLSPLRLNFATAAAPTPEGNRKVKAAAFRITRELFRLQGALPALALRTEIEQVLQSNNFVVIQGATGSGKSTQLPAYLAEMACFQGKKIICTQPRKLAATSLAMRVAEEWAAGSTHPGAKEVGGTVGYRVGALKKTRPFTQIEYWTEGTFMAQLLGGKIDMSRVAVLVLDEAHERSIALDVVVGVLKSRHAEQWPHLKIVITSATLDTALFSNYFDQCPILSIPGRMYPVNIVYRPVGDDEDKIVMNVVAAAWEIHCNNSIADGDILCFLTGQDEVEKAVEKFSALLRLNHATSEPATAFALYGKQQPEEQEVVFKPLHGRRKVVFSTDVAETSITIDGICFVVDSGLTKESVYDVRRNVTLLEVRQISRSSADQRKGRAGRTRPGTCIRLYSQDDYDGMRISQVAEILSNSLVLTVASLAARRIDAVTFPWIERPDPAALLSAQKDLTYMSAYNDAAGGNLSAVGELINKLQIDPALALMIYRGCECGLGEVAVALAGLFTVSSNLFWRGGTDAEKTAAAAAHKKWLRTEGDAVSLYFLYTAYLSVSETAPAAANVSAEKDVANNGNYNPKRGDYQKGNALNNGNVDTVAEDVDESILADEEVLELTALSLATMNHRPAMSTFLDISNNDHASENGSLDDSDDEDRSSVADSQCSKLLDDLEIQSVDARSVAESVATVLPENADVNAAIEEEAEERKTRVRANKAGAKLWCKENFVNGKSLGIAQSVMRDISKELRGLPVWTSRAQIKPFVNTEQEKAQLSENICKLVASSFFLNAAVRVSDRGEYSVIKNETATVAWPHPRSFLSQLRDQVESPAWLVFQSLFQSTKPYLNTLTPIKAEWIQESATLFYSDMLPKLNNVRNERLVIRVAGSLARLVFGRRFEKLKTLENDLLERGLGCSLQLSCETNELVVWCAAAAVDAIRVTVEDLVETARQKAVSQVVEDAVLGCTRAVYGQGGVVEQMMFSSDEYISVIVSRLPPQFSQEQLLALGSLSGRVQVREAVILNDGRNASQVQGKVTGKLTFYTTADAASVQSALNGELLGEDDAKISVTPSSSASGITSAAVSDTAAVLELTWSNAPSAGEAFLEFPTADAANDGLDRLQQLVGRLFVHCNCVGERPPKHAFHQKLRENVKEKGEKHKLGQDGKFLLGEADLMRPDTGKGAKSAGGAVRKLPFTVRLTGVPLNEDEHSLDRKLPFAQGNKPSRIEIRRQKIDVSVAPAQLKEGTNAGDAAVDISPLSLAVNEMVELLPKAVAAQSLVSMQERKGRSGLMIYYRTLQECEAVMQYWKANCSQHLKHGLPVRLEAKFTCRMSLHEALGNAIRPLLEECVLGIQRRYHSRGVHIRLDGSNLGGNRVCIKLLAGELTQLNAVKGEIQKALSCSVFVSPLKALLFTVGGRQKMQKMSTPDPQKPANEQFYLHWDQRTKAILIYGSAEQRNNGLLQLQGLAESIDTVYKQNVLFVKPSARKTVKESVAKLKTKFKLDELMLVGDKLHVMGAVLDVDALCEHLSSQCHTAEEKKAQQSVTCCDANRECWICYDETDDPWFEPLACGHAAHKVCLERWLLSAEAGDVEYLLPVACPLCKPKTSWAYSDIVCIASEQALVNIKAAAVNGFVLAHRDRIRNCPVNGCNQLLHMNSDRWPIPGSEDEAAQGGFSVYCDQCTAAFCHKCTEVLQQPSAVHVGCLCEANQRRAVPAVQDHIRHITDNILCIKCPVCQAQFIDFTGCFAVTCNCYACFCGYCLLRCADSSKCHAHVLKCSLGNGDYFNTEAAFQATHKARWMRELEQYLRSLSDDKVMQQAVVEEVKPHAAFVGIQMEALRFE